MDDYRKKSAAQNALVDEFLRELKALIKVVMSNFRDDPDVERARKRVAGAIDMMPLEVFECVGYYLSRFGSQINRLVTEDGQLTGDHEAERFFFDNTFDAEIAAGENPDRVTVVQDLLPRVQQCARTLNVVEKTHIINILVDLLDIYVTYKMNA